MSTAVQPLDPVLPPPPPKPRSRAYLVLPLLLAVGVLALVAWQQPPDNAERGQDIYRFLGRFHPTLTHAPIGLLVLVPLLDLLGLMRRWRYLWPSGQLVLWLASIGMLVAATSGYLLARFEGHGGHDTIDHMWAGIATAAWCCIALFFRSLARVGGKRALWAVLYVPALAFSLVGLVVAGHRGGGLTHGEDYLTQYAPRPVKQFLHKLGMEVDEHHDAAKHEDEDDDESLKGSVIPATTQPLSPTTREVTTPTTSASTPRTVFHAVVQPIFAQHCFECHGTKKVKGDLRLTSFANAMSGGESGSTIVPGSVADSELARLIKLPATDDEAMPPSKKPRLTSQEIDAITWWIAQGAKEDQPIDASVPPEIAALAK